MKSNQAPVHLAIDVGASGGRVLAGCIQDSNILLEEVHRFPNGPLPLGKRLVWNLLAVWEEIQNGLQKSAARYGQRIVSVGADTWGVDFVLLDLNDDLVGPAFSYRDTRTRGVMQRAFQRISRQDIFAHTGLQFMEFNSAYQLYSMRLEKSPLLDVARQFLMVPDFFHWLLCGEKSNEFTNASTTQLLDPRTCDWSQPVIQALDIPQQIFSKPIQPTTVLGSVTSAVRERTHLGSQVKVVVPATHDTGSAVLAVPAKAFAQQQPDWCYISCGTWSLMGVELACPNLTPECQALNFTNEGGVAGSVRLLKNISGLWIVQQCRDQWRRDGFDWDWNHLTHLASQAESMVAVIDPDDPSFAAPTNMPEAIRQYCKKTGQRIPSTEGEVTRCALESLALRYRMVLDSLQQLLGAPLSVVHMVGGGVQNRLLCQFAADACDRAVVAGPVEATALGNMLVQAVGSGGLDSVQQARQLVLGLPDIVRYEPAVDSASRERWQQGLATLSRLTG
ncbi:MAG: rhamnulokinase [Pirellulaceae bacterium]|nr:rhamnulokinase [Pirellulaceae bacterium]